MARAPRSADPRASKNPDEPHSPNDVRVLPVQLQIEDRLIEPPGEWEIAARPYTTNTGTIVRARVRRVDDPATGGIGSWSAHERITARRGTPAGSTPGGAREALRKVEEGNR
jgi:hypothetical protein